MNCKWTWMVRSVFLGVLMCVLLCLGMGAVKTPDRGSGHKLPSGFRRWLEAPTPEERFTIQRHLGINFRMADVSLEVREMDDFLLTPALLVQEAVSDGVILTYPEE